MTNIVYWKYYLAVGFALISAALMPKLPKRLMIFSSTPDILYINYFMKKLPPSTVKNTIQRSDQLAKCNTTKCPISTIKTIIHSTKKCPASIVKSKP